MVLKLEGDLRTEIANGTYDFKVMHVADGQEIAYRGPYSLCCQFFDNSNCVWEGEYPNQVRPPACVCVKRGGRGKQRHARAHARAGVVACARARGGR